MELKRVVIRDVMQCEGDTYIAMGSKHVMARTVYATDDMPSMKDFYGPITVNNLCIYIQSTFLSNCIAALMKFVFKISFTCSPVTYALVVGVINCFCLS